MDDQNVEELTEFERAYQQSQVRKIVEDSRACESERKTWRPGPPD